MAESYTRVQVIPSGQGKKQQAVAQVRELIHQYFNIAFLMGKPQDLPVGSQQMRIGIGLALITYVMALLVPFGVGRAFLHAAIDISLTGVLLFVAVVLMGNRPRFEQAFGGLCGASAFINLAALPLFGLRPDRVEAAAANGSLSILADFVLLVWSISLLAHVIRYTFEVKMVTSVLVSFVSFVILSSLISALMPVPEAVVSALPSGQFVLHHPVIATIAVIAPV